MGLASVLGSPGDKKDWCRQGRIERAGKGGGRVSGGAMVVLLWGRFVGWL